MVPYRHELQKHGIIQYLCFHLFGVFLILCTDRDLAAPLAGLAILLGRLHCLVDRQQSLLIALRNQAGN